MALEGLPRSIRVAVGIDVQHDPCDLAPVGTFRIRVEHAHVSDGVLFVVGGECRVGGARSVGLRGGIRRSPITMTGEREAVCG